MLLAKHFCFVTALAYAAAGSRSLCLSNASVEGSRPLKSCKQQETSGFVPMEKSSFVIRRYTAIWPQPFVTRYMQTVCQYQVCPATPFLIMQGWDAE